MNDTRTIIKRDIIRKDELALFSLLPKNGLLVAVMSKFGACFAPNLSVCANNQLVALIAKLDTALLY